MKFEIIVGSVLGATEYVADALHELLEKYNHNSSIYLSPTTSDLDHESIWIICSSTHGAGDLPDNIQPFADELINQKYAEQQYIVVGLGDSSYDTYCHGAIKLEQLMNTAGAKLLLPAIHIDVLHHPIPENVAVEYLENYLKNFNDV